MCRVAVSSRHIPPGPGRAASSSVFATLVCATPVNVKSEPALRESEAAADDDERNSTLYCWRLRTFTRAVTHTQAVVASQAHGVARRANIAPALWSTRALAPRVGAQRALEHPLLRRLSRTAWSWPTVGAVPTRGFGRPGARAQGARRSPPTTARAAGPKVLVPSTDAARCPPPASAQRTAGSPAASGARLRSRERRREALRAVGQGAGEPRGREGEPVGQGGWFEAMRTELDL